MNRVISLAAVFAGLMLLVGCGSDAPSAAFEQSELEKYVAENPVPLVTADDFKAVNDADNE